MAIYNFNCNPLVWWRRDTRARKLYISYGVAFCFVKTNSEPRVARTLLGSRPMQFLKCQINLELGNNVILWSVNIESVT